MNSQHMDRHYFAMQSVAFIIYEATIIFIILFSSCIILCTFQLLWTDLLEYYWNNVSEEQFVDKLHNIIIDVDPRIIIINSRCLLINIQRIYDRMNKYEKQQFDRLVYNNGLSDRLTKYYRKNI
jgi:hypothetical protein